MSQNNTLDMVLYQILEDAKNENDEPFRLLEKNIFDPSSPVEKLKIDDSIILRLAYLQKSE